MSSRAKKNVIGAIQRGRIKRREWVAKDVGVRSALNSPRLLRHAMERFLLSVQGWHSLSTRSLQVRCGSLPRWESSDSPSPSCSFAKFVLSPIFENPRACSVLCARVCPASSSDECNWIRREYRQASRVLAVSVPGTSSFSSTSSFLVRRPEFALPGRSLHEDISCIARFRYASTGKTSTYIRTATIVASLLGGIEK